MAEQDEGAQQEQGGQTVEGHQANIGKIEGNIGQIGDRVDTGGGTYVRGDLIIQPMAAEPRPDLDEALGLLAQLPLAEVPPVHALPAGSRSGYPPDPHFTGREAALKAVAGALKAGQPAAITGLGGMGKTALANAFVHRYGRYFGGGVCWLSFADPAAIPTEIAACGRALALRADYDRLDLPSQVALTRQAWEGPLPRLLVFDNCEEEALLDQYRPRTGGSRVLLTARRGTWAPGRGVRTFPLSTLPRPESVALLRSVVARLGAADAGQLAEALGDFPLALYLAGSYLNSYPRVQVAAYLRELGERNPLAHEALRGRGSDYSPTRHERDVHNTFLASYERLDGGEPADALALALVRRAACFAPGMAIGRELLLATAPAGEDPLLPDDALRRLLALGLLEPAGEAGIRLHRLLVAFVERLGIDEGVRRAVQEAIGEAAVRLWEDGFPAAWAPLLPHLRHAADAALGRGEDLHAAFLCNDLALLLQEQGEYAAARPLYEQALAIREAVLGEAHPHTASSLNNLAGVLQELGEYAAARSLYGRALAVSENALGGDDPETATALNNLGNLLQEQGEYAAARPLYERALAIREANLGEDDPETAQSLNNLATLLQDLGDLAAARPLYERALAIREANLGEDHPETAEGLNNLAGLLQEEGEFAAARPLFERALAIREAALGEAHPYTAESLNNLAVLRHDEGDFAAARPLYERALAIREATLGPDHPDTAQGLNNLATLFEDLGEVAAARSLYERALAIAEPVLGEEHPLTLIFQGNLAALDAEG